MKIFVGSYLFIPDINIKTLICKHSLATLVPVPLLLRSHFLHILLFISLRTRKKKERLLWILWFCDCGCRHTRKGSTIYDNSFFNFHSGEPVSDNKRHFVAETDKNDILILLIWVDTGVTPFPKQWPLTPFTIDLNGVHWIL